MNTEMAKVPSIQAKQSDKNTQQEQTMAVDDTVWMDAQNITTQWTSKKLDWKHFRPYKILEVVSPWAYHLELPKNLHVYPVQPILYLLKISNNLLPGQVELPLPFIIIDNKEEYKVEYINNSRIFKYPLQYLFK